MHEGVKILLILLGVISFMWFMSGGAERNASTYENGGRYVAPSTLPSDTQGIGNELNLIDEDLDRIEAEIKKAKKAENASPLKGKISFSYASSLYGDDPNSEYLSIQASQSNEKPIIISGMEIKSLMTGHSAIIGYGTRLPMAGVADPKEVISLNPGDVAIINSGRSPLGYSFKLNKCTGYFAGAQQYNPSLPVECPALRDEKIPSIPANRYNFCMDFIESRNSCFFPRNSDDIPENIGPECTSFVTENTGYDKCVQNHRNNSDFFKPEWRIFLKRPETLWRNRREVIELLDTNKKVIDVVNF